jgi:hypothetical protein
VLHLAHTRLTDAGAEDVAKVLSLLALLVQKFKYSRSLPTPAQRMLLRYPVYWLYWYKSTNTYAAFAVKGLGQAHFHTHDHANGVVCVSAAWKREGRGVLRQLRELVLAGNELGKRAIQARAQLCVCMCVCVCVCVCVCNI